jgi:hypothetical protein
MHKMRNSKERMNKHLRVMPVGLSLERKKVKPTHLMLLRMVAN